MADDLEKLYDAIVQAETGSFKNPYIRTTFAPKGGSTAFGPAQLTASTARDFLKRGLIRPENIKFLTEVMLPMYDKFRKYGGKDMVPGMEDYDYGGTGGFDPTVHGDAYKALAKDILEDMQKKTVLGTLERWRGKTQAQDPRYFKSALESLK